MRRFAPTIVLVALFMCPTVARYSWADGPTRVKYRDETSKPTVGDSIGAEVRKRQAKSRRDWHYRTPGMIGDFYGGSPLGFRADSTLDRLFVYADDLDSPAVLPSGGSLLTITEPGPVGILSSSVQSIQQLQALLRSGSPIPGATLVGTINADATLTTAQSISQIQTFLASTALPYDIIALAAPPGSYTAGVNSQFLLRNGILGTTVYNSASSGAMLQAGGDTLNGGEDLDAFYFYDYVVRFNTRLADASSGGVGRSKIAEGGTILPQDRVFFRYSYFDNVRYGNGVGLNRYTPGFERSFFDRLVSLELRAPFATNTTTSSTFDGDSFSNGSDTRFGNLTLYAKALLIQREQLAISGGLGILLPTASDINVNYANGTSLLKVENNSVRLQPFLGGLYTPSDRWYAQGFVQYDVAANGNRVLINSTGNGLAQAGKLTDSSNLYFDGGIGYWAYRSQATQGLTGVIPTVEIHQNLALQTGDMVTGGPFQVGNFGGTSSLTNMVVGSTFEFARRSQLTVGYTTPVGGGSDRQYNGGLQVFYNRVLGN
ncbi:MAG: hypothetical protein IT422_01465 [Pirellulaceae bacterium]|nr:hypothetical protein [Pirellulaceae bacterium]